MKITKSLGSVLLSTGAIMIALLMSPFGMAQTPMRTTPSLQTGRTMKIPPAAAQKIDVPQMIDPAFFVRPKARPGDPVAHHEGNYHEGGHEVIGSGDSPEDNFRNKVILVIPLDGSPGHVVDLRE